MVDNTWVRIGGFNYTSSDMGGVPDWVQNAMSNMSMSGAASDGKFYELKGKNFRYRIVPSGHGAPIVDIYRRPRGGGSSSNGHNRGKRRRATALVIHRGKYLLVRDKGRNQYSLPGGAINQDEPPVAAAVRELYEETQLKVMKAEYLFEHRGTVNSHAVVMIEIEPDTRVRLQTSELDDYKWWNGGDDLPLNDHVRDIVKRAHDMGVRPGR